MTILQFMENNPQLTVALAVLFLILVNIIISPFKPRSSHDEDENP